MRGGKTSHRSTGAQASNNRSASLRMGSPPDRHEMKRGCESPDGAGKAGPVKARGYVADGEGIVKGKIRKSRIVHNLRTTSTIYNDSSILE